MKCVNLSNIDLALNCAEQDNMGGLTPRVIFGYHEDVEVWPDFPTVGAGEQAVEMEAAGKLVGSIVMKEGTHAYAFEFDENVGSFTVAPQGEAGAVSFLYTLIIISRRIRALVFGFLNAAKNRKMFFIVQDSNGELYLMGDKRRGAMLVASDGATTGTAATDVNQSNLQFQYTSPRALVYTGDTDELLTDADDGTDDDSNEPVMP